MNLQYLASLPPEYKKAALTLYTEALRDKLHPILGDSKRAAKVLIHGMAANRCLVAIDKQKLVGVLGIQTAAGGFLNPPIRSIIREYGWAGGLYRFAGLSLLHHETAEDECYIDGIAVDESMRGKGTGTQLLDYLETASKNHGIRRITLEVTSTNHRAKTLYNRLGFVESKQTSLWPFDDLYGFPFSSVTVMEKQLY